MERLLRVIALIAVATLGACSSAPPPPPGNAHVGGSPPTGIAAPLRGNDAPPQIASLWFNTLDVQLGTEWQEQIETSSNVTSVEVRNNLFSINARRSGFGHFQFSLDVVDVPPIFIRGYDLRVIARNSAGVQTEEDLPLRIR